MIQILFDVDYIIKILKGRKVKGTCFSELLLSNCQGLGMACYCIQQEQKVPIQRQLGKVTLVGVLEILTGSTRGLLWYGAEWQQDNVPEVNEVRSTHGTGGWRWWMYIYCSKKAMGDPKTRMES